MCIKEEDLTPELEDGKMIPCVWCGMSPQIVAFNGCCSRECLNELNENYKKVWNNDSEPPF